MKTPWFASWFNQDYLNLYSYRDIEEGRLQVHFIIQQLHLQGNEKMLDLGCGMGRHAVIFAEEGFDVLGLDYSSVLIEKALTIVEKNPTLKLRFILGDMRDLSQLGAFDVILSLFTSFGYFDDEENQNVLSEIFHHLNPRGKFFLDYLNPDYVIKNLTPFDEKVIEGQKVLISYTIENSSVIKSIKFPHRTYHEKVKLYSHHALEKMLRNAGFQIMDAWGDFKGNPLNHESPRQIIYCMKT